MSFIYSNLQYSEFESAKVAWPPVGCDHPATTKQHERHLYKSGTEGGEGTAPPLCTHFLRVSTQVAFLSPKRPPVDACSEALPEVKTEPGSLPWYHQRTSPATFWISKFCLALLTTEPGQD